MSFDKKQREELKALSKEVFGTTSFWQNKMHKRYPLDTFEEVKARILEVQENTARMLKNMKEKGTMEDPTLSLSDKLTLAPDTPVIPDDGSNK